MIQAKKSEVTQISAVDKNDWKSSEGAFDVFFITSFAVEMTTP
ncbi:hypothetical protein [Planococcus salinus]|nr:hypothetical protein [Planococcus salinus]